MKAIVLNGSPRKNRSTAQLLRAAQKGAESAGAMTEYYDLYDLNYTGCRSCLACKRKGAVAHHCYWQDDLSPLLDSIFKADVLLIGSPIYLGDTTSQFQALLERLNFVGFTYDDYSTLFPGKVNVGIFLTMNAPKKIYESRYAEAMKRQVDMFSSTLHGKVRVYPCCDTLQVDDYSLYRMASFDAEHKQAVHKEHFPIDLQEAFKLGADLCF